MDEAYSIKVARKILTDEIKKAEDFINNHNAANEEEKQKVYEQQELVKKLKDKRDELDEKIILGEGLDNTELVFQIDNKIGENHSTITEYENIIKNFNPESATKKEIKSTRRLAKDLEKLRKKTGTLETIQTKIIDFKIKLLLKKLVKSSKRKATISVLKDKKDKIEKEHKEIDRALKELYSSKSKGIKKIVSNVKDTKTFVQKYPTKLKSYAKKKTLGLYIKLLKTKDIILDGTTPITSVPDNVKEESLLTQKPKIHHK